MPRSTTAAAPNFRDYDNTRVVLLVVGGRVIYCCATPCVPRPKTVIFVRVIRHQAIEEGFGLSRHHTICVSGVSSVLGCARVGGGSDRVLLCACMCSLSSMAGLQPGRSEIARDAHACARFPQWPRGRADGRGARGAAGAAARSRCPTCKPIEGSCDDEATDVDNEETNEQPGVKRRRRNSVNTEGERK